MTDYYYYEDATGSANGLSEANAYDGSTSTTLPDGSTNTCTFRLVLNTLESGDTLYIKKGSSSISFGGSLTPQSETTNAADHNDVEGYGYISLIGYESATGDDGRADINMGGSTLRYRPYARYENLNITGTYSNGSIFMLANASLMKKCRIHRIGNGGTCLFMGNACLVERCEFINDYSTASPSTNCVVNMNPSSIATMRNCYIEGGNGVHGVLNSAGTLGTTVVENNIIALNLDKDSSGNDNGSAIVFDDLTYEFQGGIVTGNIIYNAKNVLLVGAHDTRFGGMNFSYNIITNCQKIVEGDNTYPNFYFWPGSSGDSATHAASKQLIRASNNFFYANLNNGDLPSQESATYLTTDPFVDSANKDFTLKNPDDFGYAKNFLQSGASGDTITRNALVNIAPFTTTNSGSLSLGTGSVGDVVDVSGNSFQLVQENPRVWKNV